MNDVPPLVEKGRVASLINNATLPTSFDWATHNPPVVTPVYNQVCYPFLFCKILSNTIKIRANVVLAGPSRLPRTSNPVGHLLGILWFPLPCSRLCLVIPPISTYRLVFTDAILTYNVL